MLVNLYLIYVEYTVLHYIAQQCREKYLSCISIVQSTVLYTVLSRYTIIWDNLFVLSQLVRVYLIYSQHYQEVSVSFLFVPSQLVSLYLIYAQHYQEVSVSFYVSHPCQLACILSMHRINRKDLYLSYLQHTLHLINEEHCQERSAPIQVV